MKMKSITLFCALVTAIPTADEPLLVKRQTRAFCQELADSVQSKYDIFMDCKANHPNNARTACADKYDEQVRVYNRFYKEGGCDSKNYVLLATRGRGFLPRAFW